MATYPITPVMVMGSTVTPRMNAVVNTAVDGTLRVSSLHAVESYDIAIKHDLVTSAEVTTMETFYATNKLAQVDVTFRGIVYNCRYVKKPVTVPVGGDRWATTHTFIGTQSGGA